MGDFFFSHVFCIFALKNTKKTMRKLLYLLTACLIAVSCVENEEETQKRIEGSKTYVESKMIFSSADSCFSKIVYYNTKVEGHTVLVYCFNDRYRGNIQVVHDSLLCPKCAER